MSYAKSSLAMLLLLPKEKTGLPELEKRVSPEWIQQLVHGMAMEEIYVEYRDLHSIPHWS